MTPMTRMGKRQALRERLIAGYQASSERDQALAEDWRALEEEAWQQLPGSEPSPRGSAQGKG
jgi:hypothetical protein